MEKVLFSVVSVLNAEHVIMMLDICVRPESGHHMNAIADNEPQAPWIHKGPETPTEKGKQIALFISNNQRSSFKRLPLPLTVRRCSSRTSLRA